MPKAMNEDPVQDQDERRPWSCIVGASDKGKRGQASCSVDRAEDRPRGGGGGERHQPATSRRTPDRNPQQQIQGGILERRGPHRRLQRSWSWCHERPERPCAWAACSLSEGKEKRRVAKVSGGGHPISQKGEGQGEGSSAARARRTPSPSEAEPRHERNQVKRRLPPTRLA